jgi:26S proteasome non-ATPase regulatory subunit 10
MGWLTGDVAIALLKAGAETDKKDVDGFLAMELAPGTDVRFSHCPYLTCVAVDSNLKQVRKYIERKAEEEGIQL